MQANPFNDPDLPVGLFTRLRPWLGMLILVVSGFVVYGPALDGDFVWGDDDYVTENEVLQEPGGLRRIWLEPRSIPQYYPMVHTSFWLQYQLFGLDSGPYHVLNVILHIANALLLLLLLRALKVPGAWLATAIFLLHPISVESAAWITQRKNTLSLFFYLASLSMFCRAYGLVLEPVRRKWVWYAAGAVLFLCALFSKTVTCTLPAALWLLIWWKRGALPMRAVLETLPLFFVGIVMGLVTVLLEKHHVYAQGVEWDLTFVERILLAGRVLWFYAGKLLVPIQHAFIYPRWEIEAGDLWAYAYPLAAVIVVAGLLLLRGRLGRGPLTAVLYYAGTLFPALGFFDVYPMRFSFVADHFQYHAGIGLIVLFAGSLARLADRVAESMFVREQEVSRWIFGSLMLPVLVLMGMWSWQQAHIYKNEIALWRDTIEKNPEAWIAYSNLAVVLQREGRMEDADQLLRRSVEVNPDVLEAPFNLARLLQEVQRYDEAARYYRRALDINPNYVPAYNNLGVVLFQSGRRQEALEQWALALDRDPDHVETHLNRANAWAAMGRLDDALTAYQRVLELEPEKLLARFRMGILFFRQDRYEEAAQRFRETLAYEPDHADALSNLGLCLSQLGRPGDALGYYNRAVEIRPDFAQAWHNRAVALERLSRYDEAGDSYRRALDADPAFEPARRNLQELESMQPLL